MPRTTYRNRRAVSIENQQIRLTVLEEGGHIAELLDKRTGVNPLWSPPWETIEPSTYDPGRHPEYGNDAESRLLSGIMGHNLCMDIFGGPSAEEAAAGLGVHGEASVARYQIEETESALVISADFPIAQLRFERTIKLSENVAHFWEAVTNLSAADRPIGWTQHVTLGPPFLEKGKTQFRASATKSMVHPGEFPDCYLVRGAEFEWPDAPRIGGGTVDLQVLNDAPASAEFTTHLMDPARDRAFFSAYNPDLELALSYVWRRSNFPWLGIWEENASRQSAPWNGRTLTRGMEFGVSPIPETRRSMVERGSLFGVPGYRWVPAKSTVTAHYGARLDHALQVPFILDCEL